MTSLSLRERLEEIRPRCQHGRVVKSLLTQPRMCAGTFKPCECCENATCKPGEQYAPWLCEDCS